MNLRVLKVIFLISVRFLGRNKLWVLFFITLGIFLAILQLKLELFYQTNVLRAGLVGTFQEHDLPLEVTSLLSEGLVKADSDGRIRPNLLTGWEVNNDATIFKFKLREGVRWSDGTLMKASDLSFNIPNTEVAYPDDQTIEVHLKEAYSPLPSLLTKPALKKGTLLGTGPYRVTGLEKSRIFITKISLVSRNPNLPKVHFRFYPNEKVALAGFNLGEVSAILGFGNSSQFLNAPQIKFKQKTDYSKIVTVLFQTKDTFLANRSIRQALSFSAPKIEEEEPADSPYAPSLWAYDPEAKKYLNRIDEAKSALERAESQVDKDKLDDEIILTTTPNLEEVGKKIVNSWKGLGFDGKLRVESGIPQNFQALLITQSIPSDPDQYFLWHATQEKTNLTKYDSKRADKDLEDGRKALKEEERKEKYIDFQKTLLEDAPATFLYFPKYNVIYLNKVERLLEQVLALTSESS